MRGRGVVADRAPGSGRGGLPEVAARRERRAPPGCVGALGEDGNAAQKGSLCLLTHTELGNLPSAGCPELLDCQGQQRLGIKTSKYGTRCVQDDVKVLRSAKSMAPVPRRPGHAYDACTDYACVLASRLLYVR